MGVGIYIKDLDWPLPIPLYEGAATPKYGGCEYIYIYIYIYICMFSAIITMCQFLSIGYHLV